MYLLFGVFKNKIENAAYHLIKSRTLFSSMKGFQRYDLYLLQTVLTVSMQTLAF